jgi:branched-chain amino acid transport system substrate-binding protein
VQGSSKKRGRVLAAAAMAAAALLASACSSSGGSSSTSSSGDTGASTGSSSSAAALSKSTIAIGVMSEQSGPAESADKYPQPVAQAWATWVNNNGGINGHPVKVYYGDSEGDPATGQAQVQQLVQSDKVVALVGVADSTDAAWAAYMTKSGVPVIGGSGNAPDWTTSPDFFQTAMIPQQYHLLDAVAAKSVGAKSMTLAVCAEVATCAQAGQIVKPVASQLGIAYNGTLLISSTAPNYTAQCLQMKSSGSQVLYALISSAPAIRLYQDCAEQGYEPWIGTDAGSLTQDLTTVSGMKVVGAMQGFAWWLDDAAVKQYRQVMTANGNASNYQASAATATWAALQLFRQALSHAGATVTAQDVKNALYAMPATDLGGLLPEQVKYQVKAPTTKPFNCSYIVTMTNGVYKAPNGLKGTCTSS